MKPGKQYLLLGLAVALSGILSACTVPGKPAIRDINKTLQQSISDNETMAAQSVPQAPEAVNNALLPDLSLPKPGAKQAPIEQKIDISVNNMPAQTFFMQLVAGTPYNMSVSPNVAGNISLHLKQVTIPQVLQAVHDLYGYQYQVTPYGYQITPFELQTRIFTINYLNLTRSGASHISVSSGDIQQVLSGSSSSSGATTTTSSTETSSTSAANSINTKTKSEVWKKIEDTLTTVVGNKDGRQIIINSDAGVVVVKADPGQMKIVAEYLDSLQAAMVRQVIIDAKILEVKLDNGFQSGIDWSIFGGAINSAGVANGITQSGNNTFAVNSQTNLSPFDSLVTIGASSTVGDFGSAIKLLSTQGNVQVLSSPRIATLNNQEAIIKVGDSEFFVTDVSSNTTAGSGGSGSTTSQDITLTPFFSGISLGVTPQISGDGEVILHIHPMVSTVTDQRKQFVVNGQNQDLPLAFSQVRETDSVVYARNGQVIVIGGLMQTKTQEDIASVPGLGDLPYAGAAFRRTGQESVKSELVILLRPIVVDNHQWTKQLKEIQNNFNNINQGYHVGGHPDVFGTEGETDRVSS